MLTLKMVKLKKQTIFVLYNLGKRLINSYIIHNIQNNNRTSLST